MIELIVGKKGKGKTLVLLDKVNAAIKEANGSIVYLDKNAKHMYELNNRVRLIDVSLYAIENIDAFAGFICGIISQDHDLEEIYLDNFLSIASVAEADCVAALKKIEAISNKFGVKIVISVSVERPDLPEDLSAAIVTEL